MTSVFAKCFIDNRAKFRVGSHEIALVITDREE